jgi:hypothetical protein
MDAEGGGRSLEGVNEAAWRRIDAERVGSENREGVTVDRRTWFMLIPRVFHQVWVGLKPFPEAHVRYQETWLRHHPGWELRLWTEDNLPRDPRRPEVLERLRNPAERADYLRYELLWRFGGVYLDTDFECLRSIEPLIADARFFIGCSKPGRFHEALFGSVAGHPILDSALDNLVSSEFYGKWVSLEFGPILDAHRDEVLFLEPAILHPKTKELRDAYAVHHREKSWKDASLLAPKLKRANSEARRWRERYEEAAEQSNYWRGRYEEAEAELDRLRRSLAAN